MNGKNKLPYLSDVHYFISFQIYQNLFLTCFEVVDFGSSFYKRIFKTYYFVQSQQ